MPVEEMGPAILDSSVFRRPKIITRDGTLQEHRRNLAEGIQHAAKVARIHELYFFDAENKIKDSIVGIVAGMLYGRA